LLFRQNGTAAAPICKPTRMCSGGCGGGWASPEAHRPRVPLQSVEKRILHQRTVGERAARRFLESGNGVRKIIVETANRFARDLIVQETGFKMLRDRDIELIAADSPTAFLDDGPTSELIRQVLGAVAQFEKAMLVAKLKGARDRKKRLTGKCGGRKSHQELNPEAVALARKLAARRNKPSLRSISAALAEAGHLNKNGKSYAAESVASMLR
jgi:DNA invertase Pin-like site-specific DNA recombinase